MEDIKFTGFIDRDGRLQITNSIHFKAVIACFPNTAITGVISSVKQGISHQQRKYFYGVIVDVLHSFFTTTGTECTKEDVVIFLKDRFLFREVMNPITGSYMKQYISLGSGDKALGKEEFTEKKEAIQRWAAERLGGLEIPDPDANWRMYKDKK